MTVAEIFDGVDLGAITFDDLNPLQERVVQDRLSQSVHSKGGGSQPVRRQSPVPTGNIATELRRLAPEDQRQLIGLVIPDDWDSPGTKLLAIRDAWWAAGGHRW